MDSGTPEASIINPEIPATGSGVSAALTAGLGTRGVSITDSEIPGTPADSEVQARPITDSGALAASAADSETPAVSTADQELRLTLITDLGTLTPTRLNLVRLRLRCS